jgi:ABC-2 type transport system ATP-binding protein
MIQARNLTKHYGATLAVDDLTFDVLPARVTGFLGPNGAGKSTTMRLILGLDAPTAGSVTVGGVPYRTLRRPLFEVGAMHEAGAVHPGRSARNHLLALAQSNGIGRGRVEEVLGMVGLDSVAQRLVGTFSLGMTQRLGVATALLGDPGVLLLDEPVNGLDPEGVIWIRQLLRGLASEGRTVFVSSHLMSEMSLTADHVIVIGRGRLIADTSVAQLITMSSGRHVRVRSPQSNHLTELLQAEGVTVETDGDGALVVRGMDTATVGELAARHGVVLHELVAQEGSLEDAFMELTSGAVDYRPHGSTQEKPA